MTALVTNLNTELKSVNFADYSTAAKAEVCIKVSIVAAAGFSEAKFPSKSLLTQRFCPKCRLQLGPLPTPSARSSMFDEIFYIYSTFTSNFLFFISNKSQYTKDF